MARRFGDQEAPPAAIAVPAEQPIELAALVTPPEAPAPPAGATGTEKPAEDAPPPLPTVARVSPGRALHTARGVLREHELVEARFVGGAEHLAELVKSGSVYL